MNAKVWNLTGMALDLITAPVFCAAALAQLAGRPLVYVVTAKGKASTRDTWRTFRPHLLWLGVSVTALVSGWLLGHDYLPLQFWAIVTAATCLAPMVHRLAQQAGWTSRIATGKRGGRNGRRKVKASAAAQVGPTDGVKPQPVDDALVGSRPS